MSVSAVSARKALSVGQPLSGLALSVIVACASTGSRVTPGGPPYVSSGLAIAASWACADAAAAGWVPASVRSSAKCGTDPRSGASRRPAAYFCGSSSSRAFSGDACRTSTGTPSTSAGSISPCGGCATLCRTVTTIDFVLVSQSFVTLKPGRTDSTPGLSKAAMFFSMTALTSDRSTAIFPTPA